MIDKLVYDEEEGLSVIIADLQHCHLSYRLTPIVNNKEELSGFIEQISLV
jgi:hypothetical protein